MSYSYVLDSFAWVELFDGTEKGRKVKLLLEQGDVATSMMTIAELSDKFTRENLDLELFIGTVKNKSVVMPITEEIAINAGMLKNHIRRFSKNISLADCLNLQTAKSIGAVLVTGDPDFKDVKDGVMML